MTSNEINILGNLINTTWGKYSSPAGNWSITCSLAGENMTMKYTMIVYFASEQSLRDQVIRCAEEAKQKLADHLSKIKSDFKEASGKTLKVSNERAADDIELIQATARSPRKIAYYRMNSTVTLT